MRLCFLLVLLEGWKEYQHKETGKPYYHHAATNHTQWDRPAVAAAPMAADAAAGPGAREDATAKEDTAAAESESSSDTSDMSDDDVPAAATAAMLPGTAKPLGRGGRVSACSHASLACAHHPHARCAPFTKSDASRVHILSVCSYALGLNSKPRVHAACVLT